MAEWDPNRIVVVTALFLSLAAILNTLVIGAILSDVTDLRNTITGLATDLSVIKKGGNVNERPVKLPKPAMPDLIVTDIVFSPSAPKEGDDVLITTYVHNQGGADTNESFVVRVRDETYNITIGDSTVYGLNSNQTKTTTVTYFNISNGTHSIKSIADWLNEVRESNENNNDRVEPLNVE